MSNKGTTEILLIRHGETAWNVEKRLQGRSDIPLNAEGMRQAAALGRTLLSEPLDAIIASDLQRALQTAHAIAAPRGMQVQVEADLRERCFGAFDGLLHAEVEERYPQAYAAWRARELDARYPPGMHEAETLREFSARVADVMARLATGGQYRKLALVTHGGVLDCIYRIAAGMDLSAPRNFDILNASINRLVWNGTRFDIAAWADVTHLAAHRTGPALDEIER